MDEDNLNMEIRKFLKKVGITSQRLIEGKIHEANSKDLIKIGDTITTGGNSFIFPKGILIGSIKSFKLDNSQNYLELEVLLFNDMSNINNVYIIENKAIDEIKSLDE